MLVTAEDSRDDKGKGKDKGKDDRGDDNDKLSLSRAANRTNFDVIYEMGYGGSSLLSAQLNFFQ